MRIDIQATSLEATPPLKEYIERKIGGLEKFLRKFNPESVAAEVEVARSTKHHRHGRVYHVDVNLIMPKKMIRAAYDGEDIRVTIDIVRNKLQREIEKYKETHR